MSELTPDQLKAIAKEQEELKEKSEMTSEAYDKRQLARDNEKLAKQNEIIKRLKEIEDLGYARNDIDKREIDNAIEKIRLKEEELRLTTGLSAEQQKAFLLEVDALEARKEGMDKMESALNRYLGLTQDGGKMFDNLGDKALGAAQKFSRMMTPANLAAAGITKVAEATVALALEQDAAAVVLGHCWVGLKNASIQGYRFTTCIFPTQGRSPSTTRGCAPSCRDIYPLPSTAMCKCLVRCLSEYRLPRRCGWE